MNPIEVPYVVVDVFTRKQFGGNQLAVITDARGLSGAQMQQIASEFNFSETTFVLPASSQGNTAHVRIFNRTQEMPFAGHPNVGTAYVLGQQASIFGVAPGQTMCFEEAAGLVEVSVVTDDGEVCGAKITAPRPLEIGASLKPEVLARCVGLQQEEVLLANHSPVHVSVGLEFVVAEVNADSLGKARPVFDAFQAAGSLPGQKDKAGRLSIFIYARKHAGIDRLRARMFAPLSGTIEDPATGSASAALAAYLASLDPPTDGDFAIIIEQGIEMGRPSEIHLSVRKSQGKVDSVKISGRCVTVMRGVLEIS